MRLLGPCAVYYCILECETLEILLAKLKPCLHARWPFYGRFNVEISKAHWISSSSAWQLKCICNSYLKCFWWILSNKSSYCEIRPCKTLWDMLPKEEEYLMSLPYWGTEIPATMPPSPECCSLVFSQSDRPHHYQAFTPLWIEVQTGINRENR